MPMPTPELRAVGAQYPTVILSSTMAVSEDVTLMVVTVIDSCSVAGLESHKRDSHGFKGSEG